MTLLRASVLSSVFAASFVLPSLASADTFSWNFASANVSGMGTLTAVAYGNPGEFLITSGFGTITDTTYGTIQVTVSPCSTPDQTCTLVNTDHAGANLSYDDLLFPGNSPGSQLDGNGVVFIPGPDGTDAISIYDMPSQEFYRYSDNGFQNLTTPFTVTPATDTAVTPEPSTFALLGTGLVGIAGFVRRRLS